MSNNRFYARRRLSKKKTEGKRLKRRSSFETYQSDYSFEDFLSDVGNNEIANFLESGLVQAKLNVSQPGDFYEQEADKVANNIVNVNQSNLPKINRVQGKSGTKRSSVNSNTEKKIKGLKGKGNPLNRSVREYFEPRFGVDLGNVRVHTDNEANQLAQYIQAKAFTYGNDIVFGKGQFQPGTTEGKKLIAHELVHVYQDLSIIHRKSYENRRLDYDKSLNKGMERNIDDSLFIDSEIEPIFMFTAVRGGTLRKGMTRSKEDIFTGGPVTREQAWKIQLDLIKKGHNTKKGVFHLILTQIGTMNKRTGEINIDPFYQKEFGDKPLIDITCEPEGNMNLLDGNNGKKDKNNFELILPLDSYSSIQGRFKQKVMVNGEEKIHLGIDLMANAGDPVYSMIEGEVLERGIHPSEPYKGDKNKPTGMTIKIYNKEKGLKICYCHTDNVKVVAKQKVKQGQYIADLSDAKAISPHLHLEIHDVKGPQNPEKYITFPPSYKKTTYKK